MRFYNLTKSILFSALLMVFGIANAQDLQAPISLNWTIKPDVITPPIANRIIVQSPLKCSNCFSKTVDLYAVPYYTTKIVAQNIDIESISLQNVKTKTAKVNNFAKTISGDFKITKSLTYERGVRHIALTVIPVRNKNNAVEYITSFQWNYKIKPHNVVSNAKYKKGETFESVLYSGEFYKVKTIEDGVYKIDKSFLEANGIDVASISMKTFQIFGNGGEMLPEPIDAKRAEDLTENAIQAYDANGNDKIDDEDYFWWFAKGPTRYIYSTSTHNYRAEGHDFDVAAYYYFTWGNKTGKRIGQTTSGEGISPTQTIDKYDHVVYHESNEENHIKSGRIWWGDKMQINTQRIFDYQIPGVTVGSKASLYTRTTARSFEGLKSYLKIYLNDSLVDDIDFSPVSGSYEKNFASAPWATSKDITTKSDRITLKYQYEKSLNEAAAWIDYFTLTIPRKLGEYDDQQIIRVQAQKPNGNLRYAFSNLSNQTELWDVSTHTQPATQNTYSEGSTTYFVRENVSNVHVPLHILFRKNAVPHAEFIGKVENQNLHGIADIDYLIITSNELMNEATRLADFHRARSLVVEVVDVLTIYNEFSSGSQDVTAIRDFCKMLYNRGQLPSATRNFKYLLLFGDASYDYKNIEDVNTNIVPIYQSFESNHPPSSHCSDDYYAILDSTEGHWGIQTKDEGLDIGVGRLPASDVAEAKIMVDKIVHYHSEASLGNWIQTLTFVADDEDDNDHLIPSEQMTDSILSQNPEYNIKKIWLDAYEQVSFGSGNKYPDVNDEITKMIGSQGTLIFNYAGHGGENGMAHERVVTRSEIMNWKNYDKLSFYITASCELAKIDNLEIESPGELMMLNEQGGAIGMLATTRLVYLGTNTELNTDLLNNNLLKKVNGLNPTLGEAYRQTRNTDVDEEVNKRCFILLADPAIRLLSPDYRVVTSTINGKNASTFMDTLKALDLVTISGEVRNLNNQLLSDFNGELFPTFYDKPSDYKTLGQDADSYPEHFTEQNRIIYKGKVSVTNGNFTFQFVVPKDIAYNVDSGKLSYYAKDGLNHAGGVEKSYKVGGTSNTIVEDGKFDQLQLFMNDESWVFGGTTSPNPRLYATLLDSSGINTIGSGIGREMEAILDAGTDQEQTIILNDFYKPKLNSYQEGIIDYPFANLPAGRHTLSLKVWDVYNNSADAYTEFVISENADVEVANLLNYPNPFTTNTTFHFDHNKAGQTLKASLTISSVAGNIIKTITQEIFDADGHSADLTWNGRDDFGDPLGKGAYLYTLKVQAEDGTSQSKSEKLYIVK